MGTKRAKWSAVRRVIIVGFLLACVFIGIGCAPPIDVLTSDAELNRRAEGRDVSVVMRDQSTRTVRNFSLRGDSAFWAGSTLPRADVVSVYFKPNALPQAVRGFLGGAILGGLIGGSIGSREMTGEDKGLGFALGAGLGGGAGGVVGLTIGILTAPIVEYHVPASPTGNP